MASWAAAVSTEVSRNNEAASACASSDSTSRRKRIVTAALLGDEPLALRCRAIERRLADPLEVPFAVRRHTGLLAWAVTAFYRAEAAAIRLGCAQSTPSPALPRWGASRSLPPFRQGIEASYRLPQEKPEPSVASRSGSSSPQTVRPPSATRRCGVARHPAGSNWRNEGPPLPTLSSPRLSSRRRLRLFSHDAFG